MVKYRKNMATQLKMPYPWLATPPPQPPPPPAPRPKRKVRVINDNDSSEDEVVEMGRSSWQDRDAALRKKAVALDACVVDEVFSKLRAAKMH